MRLFIFAVYVHQRHRTCMFIYWIPGPEYLCSLPFFVVITLSAPE
uniref:Uncharacterized protein n=1 Tax=Arundo donax TaxID=35708 RepID=A0A0A9BWX4_ARUDO